MVRVHTGRRKIEMIKMTNNTNLQVTFSKRKAGLFKKASELCTLCGVDMALIVFSPGGKVFSFGHPNMDLVLDRFSSPIQNSHPRHTNNTESNTDSYIQYLNESLTKVLATKGEEKAKKQKNQMMRNEMLQKHRERWYMNPPEEFNLTQAIQMKHVVEEFMKEFDEHYPQFIPTIIDHQNSYVGSSSNVAPCTPTVHHDGNQDSFGYGPNMITPNQTFPFGYNHNNNNISERFFPDNVMNPGYNNGQLQNPDQFQQGHPHHYGNRYY